MKLFAVDSCSAVASCAVISDGKMVGEYILNDNKTHSVNLLPQIENVLSMLEIKPEEIDYFAVTVGPGSFTGQRIGIATVKGLADAHKKKCIAVSTMEAMMYNVPFYEGYVCPIMDARREQVYTATFCKMQRQTPDRAIPLSELLEEQQGKETLFLGDGVESFKDAISAKMGKNVLFAPFHQLHIRAGSVAYAAFSKLIMGEVTSSAELKPFYLRKSQAERELEQKNK